MIGKIILLISLQFMLLQANVATNSKQYWNDLQTKIISPRYQTKSNLRSDVSTTTSLLTTKLSTIDSTDPFSSNTVSQTIYQLSLVYTGSGCEGSPVTIIAQVTTSTGLLIPGCYEIDTLGPYSSIALSYSVNELPMYPYYALDSNLYTLFK